MAEWLKAPVLKIGIREYQGFESLLILITSLTEEVAEWLKAADCKSVDIYIYVGSNPTLFIEILRFLVDLYFYAK